MSGSPILLFLISTKVTTGYAFNSAVFSVKYKYAGLQRPLSTLKAHDSQRQVSILVGVDLPLGGSGPADAVGESPLGWWTLKPRPKEERELAHLYERREFLYPGDREAMKEFIAEGSVIGTTIGPEGAVEFDKDSYNYQKEMQSKKGYDVE